MTFWAVADRIDKLLHQQTDGVWRIQWRERNSERDRERKREEEREGERRREGGERERKKAKGHDR